MKKARKRRFRVRLDPILAAAKRERQDVARRRVQSGERSQERMFLIAPAAARSAKVRHRVLSFD